MTNITPVKITVLDKNFKTFSNSIVKTKSPDRNYVISQLKRYQSQYNKNGFYKDFLLRLESFALNMEYAGFLDIAGMVFSKLAKLPTTEEMKEQFLKGGLRVAQKQGDPIHILARIVDLKKLHEKSGDKNKRFKLLFSEEKALTNVVNNFSDAQNKFRTVSKGASSPNKYKYQLAVVKVDIAKKLKPKEAYPRLLEAQKIFEALNCSKELIFVNKMLRKAVG